MCRVMSCLLRRGFLFPIKFTQVSSYLYGTLYPIVKHNLQAIPKACLQPEPTCHWLLTPGSWGVADSGFQPCGQIFEMSTPSALDRRIVAIPVLTFSYARVSETQTCPIVLPRQFK